MLRIMAKYLPVLLLFVTAACQAAEIPIPPTDIPVPPTLAPGTLVVYDDLTSWENWSWDSVTDPYSTEQFKAGENAFKVEYQVAWGGFSLRSGESIDPSLYSALSFWVLSPSGDQHLFVFTQSADDNSESTKIEITASSTWTEVLVPIQDLGIPDAIKRISIQDNGNFAEGQVYPRPAIYIDDIHLVP